MGRIKITYTPGAPHNVKIVDVETGQEITHVTEVEICIVPQSVPIALLHVWNPIIELEVDVKIKNDVSPLI